MMPNASRLNELDIRNREFDLAIKQKQEELIVRGGLGAVVAPVLPGAASAADVAMRTRDETTAGRSIIGGFSAIAGQGNFLNQFLDAFGQLKNEQVKTREAIQQLGKIPAAQKQQQVRPQVAPLPAATAP